MAICNGAGSSDWRDLHAAMNPKEPKNEHVRHPLDDGHGILGFSACGPEKPWKSGYQTPEPDSIVPCRLDFAGALAAMKEGKTIAREGWGPGECVARVGRFFVMACAKDLGSAFPVMPWSPASDDMNAADWMVVL